jgi:hypothetical protein
MNRQAQERRARVKELEAEARRLFAAGESEKSKAALRKSISLSRTSIVMGGMVHNLGDLIAALKNLQRAGEAYATARYRARILAVATASDEEIDDAAAAVTRAGEQWRAVQEATCGYEDAPGVQDIRALCRKRCGTELTLESVTTLAGDYGELTGTTADEVNATPLVDVVAKLREQAEERADSADTGADTATKKRQQLPDNVDARDLAHELEKELPKGGKSRNQIALEFTRGDKKKADNLLRTIRRFPLLKKAVDAAARRRRE